MICPSVSVCVCFQVCNVHTALCNGGGRGNKKGKFDKLLVEMGLNQATNLRYSSGKGDFNWYHLQQKDKASSKSTSCRKKNILSQLKRDFGSSMFFFYILPSNKTSSKNTWNIGCNPPKGSNRLPFPVNYAVTFGWFCSGEQWHFYRCSERKRQDVTVTNQTKTND